MLRAKRRRTRTHDKEGNPIFNTMNSTPLQSTYTNQNSNQQQLQWCRCVSCGNPNSGCTCLPLHTYQEAVEAYHNHVRGDDSTDNHSHALDVVSRMLNKRCNDKIRRNPILGYRKQLLFSGSRSLTDELLTKYWQKLIAIKAYFTVDFTVPAMATLPPIPIAYTGKYVIQPQLDPILYKNEHGIYFTYHTTPGSPPSSGGFPAQALWAFVTSPPPTTNVPWLAFLDGMLAMWWRCVPGSSANCMQPNVQVPLYFRTAQHAYNHVNAGTSCALTDCSLPPLFQPESNAACNWCSWIWYPVCINPDPLTGCNTFPPSVPNLGPILNFSPDHTKITNGMLSETMEGIATEHCGSTIENYLSNKLIPTHTVYKDNYAKTCGAFRRQDVIGINNAGELTVGKDNVAETIKFCGYSQTKPHIQNRAGWINDKYNYSYKHYLQRRYRTFKNLEFNFLSNTPIRSATEFRTCTDCEDVIKNIYVLTSSKTLTNANTLFYSLDGIKWVGLGSSIFTKSGRGVKWNGKMWIAVGVGSNTIGYSFDGKTWKGAGDPFNFISSYSGGIDLDFDGDMWIAIGDSRKVVSSTDGIHWTALPDLPLQGYSIVYAQNKWIVFGESAISPNNNIYYSTNKGLTWTAATSIFTTFANTGFYNGILWVAGGTGSHVIAKSNDGITWTAVTDDGGITIQIQGVYSNGEIWVAGGMSINDTKLIWSNDGDIWYPGTTQPLESVALEGVIWNSTNKLWLAVSNSTVDPYQLAESYDGKIWKGIGDDSETAGMDANYLETGKGTIGIECTELTCSQEVNTNKQIVCAKKGYTKCAALNNNCVATYKRSNPKFSTQGAVSGGSRLNRLKYQTKLKAQSTRYLVTGNNGTSSTSAQNTRMASTSFSLTDPHINSVNGYGGAVNGAYPVSLYRNTYPTYKSNLSGLCILNKGITCNQKRQHCLTNKCICQAGQAEQEAIVTTSAPDVITDLAATAGEELVILNWSAPFDGGSPIIDYEYTLDGVIWFSFGNTNTTNTVIGLTSGTLYDFMVRAVNINGVAADSNLVHAIPEGWSWTAAADKEFWIAITSSSDGTKMVAGGNTNIYTSSDSGVTWVDQGGTTPYGADALASSSDGAQVIAVTPTVHLSSNFGVSGSWSPVVGASGTCVTSSSDGTKFAIGSSGGTIYTSIDSGANWTTHNLPGVTNSVYCITSSSDGTKLAVGVWFGSIWTSVDGNYAVWEERVAPGTRSWQSITCSSDFSKLVAVVFGVATSVNNSIWISNDEGINWSIPSSLPSLAGQPKWYSITSSSDGSKLTAIIFQVTNTADYSIWDSIDGGETWNADTSNPPGPGSINFVDIASSSTLDIKAITENGAAPGGNIWVGTPA